jgi:ankyrin repeat protein
VSEILQALYQGDAATARGLARNAELDVFEAAALGDTDRLAKLLDEEPASVNAHGEDGFHPLGLACFFGHLEAARLLIEHGADVNALSRNEHVQTAAIHAAAASGETGTDEATRFELVKLVLDRGADRTCAKAAASGPSTPPIRTATRGLSAC